MKSEKIKKISSFLRVLTGISLIGILFHEISFQQTFLALKKIPLAVLTAAVLLIGMRSLVSAYRLNIIIRAKCRKIRLPHAIKAYYIGLFFNNFIPTDIGGDIFKIKEFKKNNLELRDATSAVIIDRFAGGLSLLLLALFSLIPPVKIFERIGLTGIRTVFLGFVLLFLVILLTGYAAWKRIVKPYLKQRKDQGVWSKIYRAAEAFYVYRDNARIIFHALILSFISHVIGAYALSVLASAAGSSPSFIYLLMIIPLVGLVSLLPVSVGALGVKEGALVFCLTRLGMSAPEALSAAVTLRLCTYAHSGIGGLLYTAKKN